MLKWILQGLAMLTDLILLGVAIAFLYEFPWWFSIPAVYIMYRVWKNQGGLIAWTHRKEFMKNASELGL